MNKPSPLPHDDDTRWPGQLAAIDMGSNSFRLEIAQLDQGRYRRVDYLKETVRLGGGLDLVLDSLGGREIARGMSLLRAGGRVAAFGYAGQTSSWPAMILGFLTMKSLTTAFLLRDSQGFFGINLLQLAKDPERMKPRMAAVLELWRAGVLQPHVGLALPLARAAEAHAALEGRATRGKVVLTMGEDG